MATGSAAGDGIPVFIVEAGCIASLNLYSDASDAAENVGGADMIAEDDWALWVHDRAGQTGMNKATSFEGALHWLRNHQRHLWPNGEIVATADFKVER